MAKTASLAGKTSGKDDSNPSRKLDRDRRGPAALEWVTSPTAVVIIHGIGNQQPLTTLDAFAQGICNAYHRAGIKIRIEHGLREEHDPEVDGALFQNYIRLKRADAGHAGWIDIHEYYWAPKTEDQATFEEIQDWLKDTARQAGKFYNNDFLPNANLGATYGDVGFFFKKNPNPKPGEAEIRFREGRYRWVLSIVGFVIPFSCWLGRSVQRLIESIPVIGTYAASWLQSIEQSQVRVLSNVIGDITVYNTHNALSKRLIIRRQIIQGGVDLIRKLIQPDPEKKTWTYGRVVVAGHSLGSEVGFDILNRLNLYCSQGLVSGFQCNGTLDPAFQNNHKVASLSQMVSSLVTFGSPLDKVAFFLREQAEENEHIRRQIIENYRGFKQRRWELAKAPEGLEVHNQIHRLLDDIRWINYYDSNDYVSGRLDYYGNLENVDCQFPTPKHQNKLWTLLTVCGAVYLMFVATICFKIGAIAWDSVMGNLGLLTSFQFQLFLETTFHSVWSTITSQWLALLAPIVLAVIAGIGLIASGLMLISRVFSHSKYWNCPHFYDDILSELIAPRHTPTAAISNIDVTPHKPRQRGTEPVTPAEKGNPRKP